MSTSGSTPPSTPSPTTGRASSSSSQIRFLILIGLLGLMLGALWYDRKVARPAVEDAYARIAKLNGEINARPGNQFMTNQDVQKELNRAPIQTLKEGGYMVEVYGWRAGLPTRTHNYYAVYTDETPFIFLKHYMNYLDKEELKTMPLIVPPSENLTDAVSEGELHPSRLGGPGQSRRKDESKSSEATPEGDSVLKKADDKKPEAEENKAEEKKAEEKKPEEKKADEKKAEEAKTDEKKVDENKVEDKKEATAEKPADGQPKG